MRYAGVRRCGERQAIYTLLSSPCLVQLHQCEEQHCWPHELCDFCRLLVPHFLAFALFLPLHWCIARWRTRLASTSDCSPFTTPVTGSRQRTDDLCNNHGRIYWGYKCGCVDWWRQPMVRRLERYGPRRERAVCTGEHAGRRDGLCGWRSG